jgi:GTPase-activating protein SST2
MPARQSIEDSGAESGAASGDVPSQPSSDAKIHRRISMAEKLNATYEASEKKGSKESNTDRLRYILEEPALRSLFLRSNFCEENLSFWLDVQDFKRKFNISSSAMAVAPRQGVRAPGHAAMERHHESLINTAFIIYNTYLAPSSQCELNIDHGLRNELAKYLDEVVTSLTGKSFQGRVEPAQANAFNATQLQAMIRLYERIQMHVFRLMSTDSVPKASLNIPFTNCYLTTLMFSSLLRRQSFKRCEIGKTLTQQKVNNLCRQGLRHLQV